MKNVTINSKKYGVDGEAPIRLNNGSLVLHYNKNADVLGAYIVTSYRDQSGYCKHNGRETSQFCSLVDLDTGYLKFEERCNKCGTCEVACPDQAITVDLPENWWMNDDNNHNFNPKFTKGKSGC